MPVTAQYIIEGAYNRSSNNDPGKLAGDPELIVATDRLYQQVWAMIARARPDQYGESITRGLLGSPPQLTFDPNFIELLQVYDAAGNAINVIPYNDLSRSYNNAVACVYRLGMKLYSRNKARDPIAGHVLTLFQLGAPATLTALSSQLDPRFTARCYQLLVDLLANQLGTKDAGRSAQDRAALAAELLRSANALAAEYQLAPSAISWIHADVQRAGVNSNLTASS